MACLNAEKVGKKWAPLSMVDTLATITSGGWPRRVGQCLFVHDELGGVSWLESPAALFGWLGTIRGNVEWRRGLGYVTKEEAFQELRRIADKHVAIEDYPHEPALPGHYYTCPEPTPGDGNKLKSLLDFFCPATPDDRQLLLAMFATLVWGGAPGTRPAFLLTAKGGRGQGKSKLAQLAARLVGGLIDVCPQEEIGRIKQRLLTPDAWGRRVVLLDNVKTSRFSWAELEAAITADVISGWRIYVGEQQRPNTLVWIITLNGASLSTDMAQRTVEIQLAEPDYSPSWEEEVSAFVDTHRTAIIADLVSFLQRTPKKLTKQTRWASWEAHVLAKCDFPDHCFGVLSTRRAECDVEAEEGNLVDEYFASRLARLEYDPERCDVFINTAVAAEWLSNATGEHLKHTAASRRLRQMIREKQTTRLEECRLENARGFRFVGEHCDATEPTEYDLAKRLYQEREAAG